MRRNLLGRIAKLEKESGTGKHRERRAHLIFVEDGDTDEEAMARYRAEHPEADDNDRYVIICFVSSQNQEESPTAPQGKPMD